MSSSRRIRTQNFWVIKKRNLSFEEADKNRLLELSELEEHKLDSYENFKLYHDRKILKKEFKVGDKVLLYNNSSLSFISNKLKSKWIEIISEKTRKVLK